ncbi:MAG: YceI family protein [Saprospiraceae bacterium]|jgi:polyisoprenoid-binding protein YceI|nr:YceI family protein [Saprospiraceae bacterium]MCA0332707.1 YceI family protein [Bacteroidota bacterium]MCB0603916.1 YceI family protein [Saprospiraceae bacterium]MCO5278098.1 YceI family protein [Saprospiraceae bacterium]HQU97190.1 YceI family protein [Saprospiraceae bacterium]
MKKLSFFALFLVLTTCTFAQNWNVDKSHSRLGFKVTRMGITDFQGNFKNFTVSITPGKNGFEGATMDVNIDANSINTENDARDNHLRSSDFFDVEKYPAITYKSGPWKKTGDKTYVSEGAMTFNGVTKNVTIDIKVNGTLTNEKSKKEMAGITMNATFKRSDFNFVSGAPEATLSDVVTLFATGEFSK